MHLSGKAKWGKSRLEKKLITFFFIIVYCYVPVWNIFWCINKAQGIFIIWQRERQCATFTIDLSRINAHLQFWKVVESEQVYSVKIWASVFACRTLLFLLCLGWPNTTSHFCSTGKGRYSTAAATTRSISKCSYNVWLYTPASFCSRRPWRCSFCSFGSWCIFIYHYQGKGVTKVIASIVKYACSKRYLWIKCCKNWIHMKMV